ncbi:tRNA modification GTPase MnmE [bioreactor metagenome]|jgi:[FeFe] hydrogenase H-cluster maturation GTPase HydF|uniref:tRNA modification GTPase MnmE n=1 Tax=bioreactor metagenome TaxID=1076179 RepID=A0A644TSN8_9ZZZZ|nr:[FeFe] hydrogenase H-cluster maturation GTPase HydF [Lentimicrobium sp.]MEA5110470.1 [FeFe] hydrogenase H-cluster maturation GTPase HydF [Lentimicrobium sp.]
MSKGKDTKPHIGIFGRRNNGKSSLINALAGQELAIVSDVAGTTTDPVKKSMEIPGIGPVILIDTAGIDDTGELGLKRVEKSREMLKVIDFAILVITGNEFAQEEEKLIAEFEDKAVPFLVLHNKSDLQPLDAGLKQNLETNYTVPVLEFSAINRLGVDGLIAAMQRLIPESAYTAPSMLGDLISYGDVVLLITPIDIEAPEGRMILPQVQAIRDILDHDGIAVVCKEREADGFIRRMNPKPALVVTDSQVFLKADAAVPPEIPLTSFSILLARQRGDFRNYLKGTPKVSELKDGDRILILESCTHHVSCDDIGRVKIPRWLGNFTGKKLEYEVVAGLSKLPRDIRDYAMVIQCGGCVITRKQIINRLKPAVDAGIPVTNYGMAIAWVHGIYNRAVAPFTHEHERSGDYL